MCLFRKKIPIKFKIIKICFIHSNRKSRLYSTLIIYPTSTKLKILNFTFGGELFFLIPYLARYVKLKMRLPQNLQTIWFVNLTQRPPRSLRGTPISYCLTNIRRRRRTKGLAANRRWITLVIEIVMIDNGLLTTSISITMSYCM